MKKKKIILLLMLFLIAQFTVLAQQAYKGASTDSFERDGDYVYVNIQLQTTGLFVESGQSLVLTPVILAETKKVELPSVILNEGGVKPVNGIGGQQPYAVQSMTNRQNLDYKVKIPYEAWMANAQLGLKSSLYDSQTFSELYGYTNTLINSPSIVAAKAVNYAEAKQPTESKQAAAPTVRASTPSSVAVPPTQVALASVPQNTGSTELKTAIFEFNFANKTSYMVTDMDENKVAIDRLFSTLERIMNDKSISLSNIEITAVTSIDGIYYDNEQLTKKQALALKSYIQGHYSFADTYFQTRWDSEDWAGLTKLIEQSDMQYKNEVLNIINNTGIFTGRERMLMELASGDPYRYMKANLFAPSRKIECKISYKVL